MQHRTRSSNEKRSWPQVVKFAGAQYYHRFWQQKDSTWRTEAISIHHGNDDSTMTSAIRYQFGRSLWRRVDLATKRRLVAHDDAASCSNKRQSTSNQTALAIVWAKAVLMTMDWDPLEMTWIQNKSANWNISMNWSPLSGMKITSFLDKGRFHVIVSQHIFGASLWSEPWVSLAKIANRTMANMGAFGSPLSHNGVFEGAQSSLEDTHMPRKEYRQLWTLMPRLHCRQSSHLMILLL